MNKYYYTTPFEQTIMESIDGAKTISTHEIYDMFHDKKRLLLKNVISDLSIKGYLFRLKRGLYLVSQDRVMDPDMLIKVGTQIHSGYVAFSSALYLHKLLDYHPFTIFIATSKWSKKIEFGEYDMMFVAMGKRLAGLEVMGDIWVSDLEKTLFDCIYKPDKAGGYQNITKAFSQIEDLNWDRFESYLCQYGTDPMRQRAGYILDALSRKELIKVPNKIGHTLRKSVKGPTRLNPGGSGKGKFDPEWKILDNVGEKTYFGWMTDA
jgi:predicted transcriptional regulator of viral defense system